MKHTETVKMAKSEIDRINMLLDIPSLSELTDDELRDMGAFTDAVEGVYAVRFDELYAHFFLFFVL